MSRFNRGRFVPVVATAVAMAACGPKHVDPGAPAIPAQPPGPSRPIEPAPPKPPIDPNRPIIDAGTGGLPDHLRALPPHMRPGRHTLTLDVAQSRNVGVVRTLSPCVFSPYPLGAEAVGWGQFEDCGSHVLQRAVLFDTTLLDQMPDKLIEQAVLSYEESRLNCPRSRYPNGCWTNGEGAYEFKPDGCVDVRVPDGDWRTQPPPSGHLLATAPVESGMIKRKSPREWDVTVPFSHQAGPTLPLGGVRRYGFLLSGWPWTLDQLTADDSTNCISRVTNVQLRVTYSVPPAGPGFVPPN